MPAYTLRPGFWLVLSLLVAVLVANTAWLVYRFAPVRRFVASSPGRAFGEPLAWLGPALYMLLPPFAAWRAGALSPYFLGVTEIDWLEALGAAGLLTGAVSLLALAAWLVYRRSLRLALASAGVTGHAQVSADALRFLTPLDALLTQWHWAFYRGLLIGWLAAGAALPPALTPKAVWLADAVGRLLTVWHAQPVYWGSWLGLVVALVEGILNPFAWRALRTPGRLERATRMVGMAVATTALFSLTRNLWLCLACAGVVELLIAGWFPGEE